MEQDSPLIITHAPKTVSPVLVHEASFDVAKNGSFLQAIAVFDQSDLNETWPELRTEPVSLIFVGTFFGELNVYKLAE